MPDNLPLPAILTDSQLRTLLEESRRIAVLGIKPETRADRPAHFVPAYLADAGYEVIPVPVYYPEVTRILRQPVYRTLEAVPGPVDIVVVFRPSEELSQHTADIIAKRPRVAWFQSGIRDDAVAKELRFLGMTVVQDRCIMTEHERLVRAGNL